VTIGADDGPDGNIWVDDLSRNALTKLTFQHYNNFGFWTPDGKRVTFMSTAEGTLKSFWQLADGSGGLERLTSGENAQFPNSWSPDGQLLAFTEQSPTTGQDLWVQRIGDRQAQPFLRTPFNEHAAQFSPDGHFLAYTSDESGRNEVYVQLYPGPGGKWQLSTDGGIEPKWNRNGRELFYRNGNAVMAVDITTQHGFAAGTPQKLFEGPYVPTSRGFPNYDVSSDGQQFLMVKASDEPPMTPTQINVVLNWSEELKQRVPAGLK
jgi:Tol biopolymer transport system component